MKNSTASPIIFFIEKYIPKGKNHLYIKKAGLSKDIFTRWKKKSTRPNTLSLIYLCRAISQLQPNLKYENLIFEAIKQGAKNV